MASSIRCSTETDASVVIGRSPTQARRPLERRLFFVGLPPAFAFYGVSSRELSSWTKDEAGLTRPLQLVVRAEC